MHLREDVDVAVHDIPLLLQVLPDFSVTVFEGVTVSSEVAGYHVDEADVLEVAYSLRTVEPGDFIDYVSGDG